MRNKEEDIRRTYTKRKKKLKKNEIVYEQMSNKSHLGGASFVVNNDSGRLFKWKKLLYTRYYLHLGKRKDINVNYKCTKDNENNDIEERYRISTAGKSEKMSLSITIYHNTGRILIQGTNKKEWINNEFEKLKN